MDLKQILADKINAKDTSNIDITLTVEQAEELVKIIDDSCGKDDIIDHLRATLKEKDTLTTNIYAAIINDFIKKNS